MCVQNFYYTTYLGERGLDQCGEARKKEQVQDKTKTSSQVWNRPEGTRNTGNRKESVAKRQSSSDSHVQKRDMRGEYIHPLDESKRAAKLKGESFSDVPS